MVKRKTADHDLKIFQYVIPSVYFLCMLLICLYNRKIGDYGVETDFYVAYVPQAKDLLNGILTIDSFRGPVYQIVLAVSGGLIKDFYIAGKIINVISASAVLFFAFGIVRILLNCKAAFFATLLISVNLIFWRYTYQTGTDMLFICFYVSSLYFLLKDPSLPLRNMLIAGVLSGIAYLTRYTGISLIIFVGLLFLLMIFREYKITHSLSKSIPVKKMLMFFTPVFLMMIVWALITYNNTGEFFYNKNYQNTALVVYKPDDVLKDEWFLKQSSGFNSMADVVTKDPFRFVKKISINFVTYFLKDMRSLVPGIIGLFVIAGLIFYVIGFKRLSSSEKYFGMASLLLYLQILLIFYSERFTLPLLVMYSYLIVKVFDLGFIQKFNFKFLRSRFFSLILFILIAYGFYNSFKVAKAEINAGPTEILMIKDSLQKDLNVLKGKSVMARKPHIAYYLDMNFIATPFSETYDEFLSNVRKNNVQYVYVSDFETSYLPDENLRKKLLDYSSPPPEFEIVSYTTSPVSILYKVRN